MAVAGQCRFPRSARVLSPKEFKHVFSKASKSGDRCWTVLARPNFEDRPRLGLAISKKHAARAVDRNRLKRLVRESFRSSQIGLCALDYIVMAKPGTVKTSVTELRNALQKHWSAFDTAESV